MRAGNRHPSYKLSTLLFYLKICRSCNAVSALFFKTSRFPRTLSLACETPAGSCAALQWELIQPSGIGPTARHSHPAMTLNVAQGMVYLPRDAEHGDEGPVERPEYITSRVAKEGHPKDAVCMQMLVRVTSTQSVQARPSAQQPRIPTST
jgi:hypothetical protein